MDAYLEEVQEYGCMDENARPSAHPWLHPSIHPWYDMADRQTNEVVVGEREDGFDMADRLIDRQADEVVVVEHRGWA